MARHPARPLAATAHYGCGSAALWSLEAAEPRLLHRIEHNGSGPVSGRQEGPHAHCALFHGDELLIADLGADRIHRYGVNDGGVVTRLDPLVLPPGTGPRHLAATGTTLWLNGELDGSLHCFRREGDSWAQSWRTHPFGASTSGLSALKIAGDAIWLAGRQQNSLIRYRLSPEGHASEPKQLASDGDVPRDLDLSIDARWLAVANQASNRVSFFAGDEIGTYRSDVLSVTLSAPVCCLFLD